MGVPGRSRKLGRRSRLYALFVAPLSKTQRWILSAAILASTATLIISGVVASNSQVGTFVRSPFAECWAERGWEQAEQAAGQPSATTTAQSSAVWLGQDEPLACGRAEVSDEAPLQPHLQLYLQTGPPTSQESDEITSAANTSIAVDEPVAIDLDEQSQLDTVATIEFSSDNGNTWHELGRLTKDQLNDRPLSLKLPPLSRLQLEKLQTRLTLHAAINESETYLVDSVALVYQIGAPASLSVQIPTEATGDSFVLSAQNPIQTEVKLDDTQNNFVSGTLAQLRAQPKTDVNISASVQSEDGKVAAISTDTKWQGSNLNGDFVWDVTYTPSRDIEPGAYQLTTRLTTKDNQVIESVSPVLIGVVALNFDRSSYAPNQMVNSMISVLDERGATVCDAEVWLDVIKDEQTILSRSSEAGQIRVTDTCKLYGEHIEADYVDSFGLSEVGEYEIKLRVKHGDVSYVLFDTLNVEVDSAFVITRSGPTRLFPVVSYPMKLTVNFNRDFNGTIEERVPANFKLVHDPLSRVYELSRSDDTQILTWQVEAKSGDELIFLYRFDAPDISPAFYTLGPLTLSGNEQFSEPRSWQLAGDAIGRMLLFWDGGAAPTGWTCVSCAGGDPFYQRFVRGAGAYGGTGGSSTSSHTADGTVDNTTTPMPARSNNPTPNELNNNDHTHSFSPTVGSASNLPSYRQLQVIRHNTTGQPSILPAGAIAMFDTTVPSGWTQYSAQNGYYIRGENTAGTTGGSNTHTHAITGTTGAASGGLRRRATASTQANVAAINHTHNAAGTSTSANHEPPYIETILGQLDSDIAPPDNMLAMWDDEPPSQWVVRSDSGGTFDQRFIKADPSFGDTGGSSDHSHSDTNYNSGIASASVTSRTGGTVNASDVNHVHNVNVTNFSTDNHLPPYIDVIIAKKQPTSTLELAAYRWFANQNSTDVGSPLAAQDTATSAPKQGTAFRLRLLVHVSTTDRGINGSGLKLQVAARSGSCDTSFIGETYTDVSDSSGDIRYYDNSTPADGDVLTGNANDPTHSGHTVNDQSYDEANNFTNNQSAIASGEDGLWDLALVDFSAAPSSGYCFRAIRATGDLLDTYTVVPEITTDDGVGHMLLFWDGGGTPSGWSCVSCNPGDDYYQRFVRGEAAYGSPGGSDSHGHTADGSLGLSGQLGRGAVGTGLVRDHDHSFTPTVAPASNLPSYRQLKIIRADGSGTPGTIPAGAIAIFDASVPSGWTRYSAQDGAHIRGEGTAGTTGGSNTHTHAITGTTSTPTNGIIRAPNISGTQSTAATDSHTHSVSGNSPSANNEPPYIQTILGEINSDGSVPTNMLAMWDAAPPSAWSVESESGDPFYQRFMRPAATYGTTGGNVSHAHTSSNITTSAPSSTVATQQGGSNVTSPTHTHTATISNYSTDNHLPPYFNTIIAKLSGTNTSPDNPTNLDQIKISTASSIAVGGWSDDVQVQFSADMSDPDNPDSLAICVEVQPLGTGFSNTETACGSAVAYSGSAVSGTVTLFGLTNTEEYHWQARVKDGFGAYSGWVSFGANAESARDFAVDNTDPSGQVYDGTTVSVDIDVNSGSLSTLSANWSFTDTDSDISGYEYSLGTSSGGTDLVGWTSHGTNTSVTESSLVLQTGQAYFVNIRATDVAGNQNIVSSDGQIVAPTLSFSTSPGSVVFDNLNSGNGYTSSETTTLTTSTNAYGGYVVRAFINQLPTSQNNDTIPLFSGGTYASPDAWQGGDIGYGYTSNDSLVQGVNLFGSTPCAGGGNPPCYSPFSMSPPGDIVADHTDPVSGTPVSNENFIVTHRVTTNGTQAAGTYTTLVIYTVTARY